MKAFAHTPGDSSVGLFEINQTYDLGDLDIESSEHREAIRSAVKGLHETIWDDPCDAVWFEDECLDCGKVAGSRYCDDCSDEERRRHQFDGVVPLR